MMVSEHPPILSIIVIGFNIEEYLQDCFYSIVVNDLEDIEVIYVDDGSTDSSREKAKEALVRFPHSKLITQENSRAGGARNSGISASCGKYISFIDGDDFFSDGGVQKLVELCRDKNFEYAVFNRYRYFDATGELVRESKNYIDYEGPAESMDNIFQTIAVHGKIYSSDFLKNNNIRFPEGVSVEDFSFHYEVCALAKHCISSADVVYSYRKRAGENKSLTQDRCSEFSLMSRFEQIKLTTDIVERFNMQIRFPYISFKYLDYQVRLLRHLSVGGIDSNIEARNFILDIFRVFLSESQERWLHSVDTSTRALYIKIIDGKYDDCYRLLMQRKDTRPKVAHKTIKVKYKIIENHLGVFCPKDCLLVKLERPLFMNAKSAKVAYKGERFWYASVGEVKYDLYRNGLTPLHYFYVRRSEISGCSEGIISLSSRDVKKISRKRLWAWKLLWSWRSGCPQHHILLKTLGPIYRATVQ